MKTFISVFFVWMLAPVAFAIPTPAIEVAGLTDLSGKPSELAATKEKSLVVFWATWCDDCRSKLRKELVSIDQRKDVSVVTVNLDKDAGRAQDFVTKEGITLPVLRDPDKKLKGMLKVFSVPHWAVLKKIAPQQFEIVASESAFDLDHVNAALGPEGGGKP